jgi:hypothetical protein
VKIGILLLLLSSIFLGPSYLNASTDEPTFFRKNSSPFGIPYSEWPRIWWQYWVGIPEDHHPSHVVKDGVVLDPVPGYDSSKCAVHQEGPVWFLPDVIARGDPPVTKVDFSCEVPKGKAILFPLSTSACWLRNPEFKNIGHSADHPDADQRLTTCATNFQTVFNRVLIDGKALDTNEIKEDRVTTGFFNMTVPSDPITTIFRFGDDPPEDPQDWPGTSKARANGYFLFLSPLPEGNHQIVFTVTDDLGDNKLIREGNYTLFVK